MAKDETSGPRNFAADFAEFADGEFNTLCGVAQQKLLGELQDNALSQGTAGKAKGTMVIKIDYLVTAKGALGISPGLKVTSPKPIVPPTAAWVDKNANITRADPRQQRLPLREVPQPGPARDVLRDTADKDQ